MPLKSQILEKYTPEQIRKFKENILDILEARTADTLSDACKQISVKPTKAYDWMKHDRAFKNRVNAVKEVIADEIFKQLLHIEYSNNSKPSITALIFLLKGLRPEFRDTFKIIEEKDQKTRELLEELRKMSRQEKKDDNKTTEPSTPSKEKQKEYNPLIRTIDRLDELNV